MSDAISNERDDQFLRDAISGIEPGQTVLLAELDGESAEPVEAAVAHRGGRVFRTNREVTGKAEQVRHEVRRDLDALNARIESNIATDEAQRDWENDTVRDNDIKMVDLMTIDQQSEYDVYAGSQGPASTRPVDE